MFWRLTNDRFPSTFINIDNVEAITILGGGSLINVHVVSGKEYRAHVECLDELSKMLNIKFKIK